MTSPSMERVFGGSPISVLSRLVLLSILAGVVFSIVGLDPMHILNSIQTLARQVYDMGFDAVRYLWRYFLLGAVVVVPLWILTRLVHGVRR